MLSTDRLLLVLPIKAFRGNGRVFIDKQACNGVRLWLKNFDAVILACLVEDRALQDDGFSPLDEIVGSDRLEFFGLPDAYAPGRFARSLLCVSRLLSKLIDRSNHLQFAIGGLWGDWASVAGIIATRKKRPFAVWTDRVESEVAWFDARSRKGVRRLYLRTISVLMKQTERYIIGKSELGLFHGRDCYDAFARFSKNPALVHNIHLGPELAVTKAELDARNLSFSGTLRIVYAGRAHREKGIFDWVDALKIARSRGLNFEAVWYGDGPDRHAAISVAPELGARISFPGAIHDHQELISRLKVADVFVFCHKLRESPRSLVEALICGLPIVGYDSAYPRDLIRRNAGGWLTPANQPLQLANALLKFEERRLELTQRAERDGSHFNDEAVFHHRSQLIKSILHRSEIPMQAPLNGQGGSPSSLHLSGC